MILSHRILLGVGTVGAILGIFGSLLIPDIQAALRPRQHPAPPLPLSAIQRFDHSEGSSRHIDAVVRFINQRRAGIPLEQESAAAIESAIDSWLREDPIACIDFLGEVAPALLEITSVSQAIIAVAGENPNSRIAFALRISNPVIQERTIRAAAMEIIKDAPTKAFETISIVPQYIRYDLQVKAAEALVATEQVKSLELVLSDSHGTVALVDQVLTALSHVNPLGGLSAIKELDEHELSNRWSGGVTKEFSYSRMLGKTEPTQALAFLQELPPTSYTINATRQVLARVLKSNPSKAAELLGQYPNALMVRVAALNTAIDGVLQDPIASASLVNSIPGERMRETAIREIVSDIRFTKNPRNLKAVTHFVNALQDPLSMKVGQEALAARNVEVSQGAR